MNPELYAEYYTFAAYALGIALPLGYAVSIALRSRSLDRCSKSCCCGCGHDKPGPSGATPPGGAGEQSPRAAATQQD